MMTTDDGYIAKICKVFVEGIVNALVAENSIKMDGMKIMYRAKRSEEFVEVTCPLTAPKELGKRCNAVRLKHLLLIVYSRFYPEFQPVQKYDLHDHFQIKKDFIAWYMRTQKDGIRSQFE